MKISGFTFVRNAIKFDYPIIEAITSILPICDEFIVNVGNSEDDTLELIQGIPSDKIVIVQSVWDDSLRTGGRVLAQQTNIALSHCTGDWCFYIQGDEVVHERYLPAVEKAAEKYLSDHRVEGLLFKYIHFYGTYDFIGASRRWYRQEVRMIRNGCNICSYKDAQGFRANNKKLPVKRVNAYINHYGWVKPPEVQQAKQKSFNKLWHSDEWVKNEVGAEEEFDYSKIDLLVPFTDTHPAVMKERLSRSNWKINYDPELAKKNLSTKHLILNKIENLTGYRLGEYKNFRVL